MSSTNRGKERHRKDDYPTPDWCLHRLMDANPKFLVSCRSLNFLEPCAGDGAIIRAYHGHELSYSEANWEAVELRNVKANRKGLAIDNVTVEFGDFFKSGPVLAGAEALCRYHLAITNPPFSLAFEFIKACWPISDPICFLLRLNFLGSAGRHPWMQQHMPDVYIIPDRPKFAKNKDGKWGTDSIEYAWMHWDTSKPQTHGRIQLLDLTPLEKRNEGRT